MNLPTLVRSWFSRKAVEPIAFHPPYTNLFGPGVGNQPTHDTLLRENLGVADTATRAIANRLSTLNLVVKVIRRVREGTEVEEILDDHVLKNLLDRPHPNISRAQLLRLTGQYIVTVGEAYWLKVGNGLGVPTELHPMLPGKVFPVLERGVVSSYVVEDGNGARRELAPESVVRMYFPDPENPWASEGYIGPSAITVDSLKFAGEHLRAHYQTDATPKSVLETGPEAQKFEEPERERFVTEWRARYHNRRGTQMGVPGILPIGYKLVWMAMQSGADIVPLLEYWRDETLMSMGTPRSVLGQVVSGDRSSAETNQYVFDLHTIKPIADLIAASLTLQLAPDFDSKLIVCFEDFVSQDKQFRLQQEQSDLDRKVRSINQVRDDRGLDHVEWGEDPVAQMGQVPYDPSGLFDLPMDDEGALEDEEEEEERKRSDTSRPNPKDFKSKDEFMAVCIPQVMGEGKTKDQAIGQCSGMWENRDRARAAFFTPKAEWLRQIRREKKYTPAFEKAMLGILAMQRRSVLKRLEEVTRRARVLAEDLFNPEEWASIFERRVEPIRTRAFETILKETLTGLGTPEAFLFTDQMRQTLRMQGAQLVQHANATTKRHIARALEVAVAEGAGAEETARLIEKNVNHVFTVRRHQARTIARTEVLKATQTAQIEGFETSGVVERKQWNTSMDDAVRDSHSTVQTPMVGLREPFLLGDGELADAPGLGVNGGPLSASNSINCRCFVTPVIAGS